MLFNRQVLSDIHNTRIFPIFLGGSFTVANFDFLSFSKLTEANLTAHIIISSTTIFSHK